MKIEHLRRETSGNRARIAATLTWEDCDRPTRDVYFETGAEFAEGLSCSPDPFVVAGLIPALWHGEARLLVDGDICPQLRDGLATAMGLIRHWYGLTGDPVRLEAGTRSSPPAERPRERAGYFFSGGIDSLATLRANRLNYPPTHPGSIKDGLIVYGLEVDQPDAFAHVLSSLSAIARDADLALIPVYTNERDLDDDWAFWRSAFEAAVFAAVGHAFKRRMSSVYLASSYDIPNLRRHGSHPLLDPNYGSHELTVRHDGIALSRLDKTRLVAGWPVALDNLRVCNKTEQYQRGRLNCGACEKCVRTMLALLALGALEKTRAFPPVEISEPMVAAAIWEGKVGYYPELIEPLRAAGRPDLARCIERQLARHDGTGWRVRLGKLDAAYLGGSLSRLKRLAERTRATAS